MNNQINNSFTFSFESTKNANTIFEILSDVRQWWVGLYEEEITGSSAQLNDEFTFIAGGNVHYSKQRLVELIPNKKLVWKVIESNLSFLNDKEEWTGTAFGFEISEQLHGVRVTFTHTGLVPQIECYENCSNAWSAYLRKIAQQLE